MRRMPLLWKILLYSSSLLVGLITAMLVYVNHQAERFVGENTGAELKRGIERIHAAEAERLERLELTARLVASFPSLKALLATDFATIRDFLNEQKENVRFELLIVLDPSGRVVARNDTVAPAPLPDAEARWVQPILTGRPALSVLATERGCTTPPASPPLREAPSSASSSRARASTTASRDPCETSVTTK